MSDQDEEMEIDPEVEDPAVDPAEDPEENLEEEDEPIAIGPEDSDEPDEEATANADAAVVLAQAAQKAVDDIIAQLIDLMEQKKTDIQRHASQKGGWEGWLQTECIDHLTKINLMSYDVSREQHVFPTRSQSIDLWCTPTKQPGKEATPAIGIELKVASRFQEAKGPLWKRFNKDIEKCEEGPAPKFIAEHDNVVMLCIGITYLNSDVKNIRENEGVEIKKVNDDVLAEAIAAEDEEIPEDLERALWVAWWANSFP